MERLTINQLKDLALHKSSPSISIYLPTHSVGQEIQQDPIRFKNLLRDAEKKVLIGGMAPREVRELLHPAQALLDDSLFWKYQYDGLAVFLSANDFHYYRLPFLVDELLIVAESYYFKPVLPLFMNNGHYYILALSQNEVRLFEATQHSVGQIDLPEGTPKSLDEALKLDDPQKQLQMHSGSSQGVTANGIFHGQGPGGEEQKVWIERYLNLVDKSLKEILNKQQSPLVLAGVDYLLTIYRKVSEYANIMPDGITGNPEHLRPEELLEQAWPIVESYFFQDTENTIKLFEQLAGTEKATDNVEEIITAAFNGRVDKLIISVKAQIWGTYNPVTRKIVLSLDGQSVQNNLALLDAAVIKTIQNGGTVYAQSQEEMPTDSVVAAIFRY